MTKIVLLVVFFALSLELYAQIGKMGESTGTNTGTEILKKAMAEKFGFESIPNTMNPEYLRGLNLDRASIYTIESRVKKEVDWIENTEQRIEKWTNTNYPMDTGPVLYPSGAFNNYGYRDVNELESSSKDLNQQKGQWDKFTDLVNKEGKKFTQNETKKALNNAFNLNSNPLTNSIAKSFADDLWGSKEDEEKRQQLKEQIKINDKYFAKYELMEQFEETLSDTTMSVVARQANNYFFIVNIEHPYGISFSVFDLKANAYNQLPYKVELMKKYAEDTKRDKNYLYGPFSNLSELREQVDEIALMAYLAFWKVAPDVGFAYDFGTQNSSETSADFWGTSNEKAKPKEETKPDDFWGVSKKKGGN